MAHSHEVRQADHAGRPGPRADSAEAPHLLGGPIEPDPAAEALAARYLRRHAPDLLSVLGLEEA